MKKTKPVPVVHVNQPSGVFVKLPIAPETLGAVSSLVETFSAAEASLRSFLGACVVAGESLAASADRRRRRR